MALSLQRTRFLSGKRNRGNRPERFWEVFGSLRGSLKNLRENGQLFPECTSQRCPGNLSETLSEILSERQFSLRAVGNLPLNVLPLETPTIAGEHPIKAFG